MNREQEIILARMVDMRKRIDGFEGAALKSLLKTYQKSARQVVARLDALNPKAIATRRQQLGLLSELETAVKVIAEELAIPIAEATAEVGVYSYPTMNAITSWDGNIASFAMVSMSKAQIAAMVTEQTLGDKKLNGWIEGIFGDDLDEVKREISAGRIKGEGYKKTVGRLVSLFGGDKPRRDIETIVKSYIQSINGKAQQDVYAANKNVVKQVEWTAIMENANTETGRGTCIRCQALDGQKWKQGEPRPDNPLHPRCRCMLLPVTKTWKELGLDIEEMNTKYKHWYERDLETREKLGHGFTDKDYAGFWATKSKEWQDNAIGPVRAELVRSGKVSFGDLTDRKTGRLIPIHELIGKEGGAKVKKKEGPGGDSGGEAEKVKEREVAIA